MVSCASAVNDIASAVVHLWWDGCWMLGRMMRDGWILNSHTLTHAATVGIMQYVHSPPFTLNAVHVGGRVTVGKREEDFYWANSRSHATTICNSASYSNDCHYGGLQVRKNLPSTYTWVGNFRLLVNSYLCFRLNRDSIFTGLTYMQDDFYASIYDSLVVC